MHLFQNWLQMCLQMCLQKLWKQFTPHWRRIALCAECSRPPYMIWMLKIVILYQKTTFYLVNQKYLVELTTLMTTPLPPNPPFPLSTPVYIKRNVFKVSFSSATQQFHLVISHLLNNTFSLTVMCVVNIQPLVMWKWVGIRQDMEVDRPWST